MRRRWLRIAHRGASGSAPEHTRAAFERALDLGVDMIELDVQLSRDHELVVIHDVDLSRTTSGQGMVREHNLAELQCLDAGAWFGAAFVGQHLLTLADVIELVGRRARLNVEVKAPRADWLWLVPRLVDLLRRYGLIDSTIVSCFDPEALAALRQHASEARLGLLWQQPDLAPAWNAARAVGATSIHPHWMLVGADLIAAATQRGLDVVTWTVNDVPTMRRLVDDGVAGVISDVPERFAELES